MLEGRARGSFAPLDFENFIKKGCFLSFEWEKKQNSPHLTPLEKFWKNPLVVGKNPTLMPLI